MDTYVNINIYDLNGRLVKILLNKQQSPGYKKVRWAGIDNSGRPAGAGLYFYKFEAGEFIQTRKMVLIK